MARLSLCMIVRDEARCLAACLDSARGTADEIVVVDTGSTDETPAIAARAGARVLHVAWRDDFAAARNAGLEAATGTHVLVLDADEVLAPGAGKALRRALGSRGPAIGMLPLHDADALEARPDEVVSGARRLWPPTHVPRLFRNHPRLRYRRRVHETLFHDIDATLRAVGGGIAAVDAPIVHYGEVRALRQDLDKGARNRRLLELALAEDPADGDLAGYLALELVRAGERAAALELARRHLAPFLATLAAMPEGALKPSPIQLASVLATLQLERGDAAAALATARGAAAVCPAPHPNLRYLEGLALERLGELADAERAFQDCLAMHGRPQTIPINPGATDEGPRLRLANVYLAQDRASEALDALGLRPLGKLEPAAALARAEAFIALGDASQAFVRLAPLMDRPDPPPDMFALAARAAELLGEGGAPFAAAAAQAPAEAWLEPRRRAAGSEPSRHRS